MTKSTESINPLSVEALKSWSHQVENDPVGKLALAAVSNSGIDASIRNRKNFVKNSHHEYSDKIEKEGSPMTDQKASGRCWIFTGMNVLRVNIQRDHNIEELELSQSYLFFYDKLEKSNFFLQNIIETAHEPLDSRLMATLFSDNNFSDGGQFDMLTNLMNKYGAVPKSVFPDAHAATSSNDVNFLWTNKLREYGLLLRKAIADGKTMETVNQMRQEFLKEVHRILVIAFGVPPAADEEITWEFTDKDKKFHRVHITPLQLYKEYGKVDANEYFSLIHDPRNKFDTLYTVDRLGNVVNGKPIEYVNAEISALKQAAIKSIQNNEAVFFGCDVGKFSDSKLGIMDTGSWDHSAAFGTGINLTKEDRLRAGSSMMTHAMTLTAVNLVDGKPTKWRVENSWGDERGKKGYFLMSDEWFDEYVFQVVTKADYTEKKYVDVWKSKDYVVLPLWDPLGALA
jgi:bleomycin hydrolase